MSMIKKLRERLCDLSLVLTDDGVWARCPFCQSLAAHPYGHQGRELDKTQLVCLDCDGPISNPRLTPAGTASTTWYGRLGLRG